jgi:hypothetical protein
MKKTNSPRSPEWKKGEKESLWWVQIKEKDSRRRAVLVVERM